MILSAGLPTCPGKFLSLGLVRRLLLARLKKVQARLMFCLCAQLMLVG